MKIFLDTAEVHEVKELLKTELINGVTTNPTLIAKSGRPFKQVIEELAEIVPGPVSAEVTSNSYEDILIEGRVLADIAPNVVVKLPLTQEGLKACRQLTYEGIHTNVTLCFNAAQALLAAKSGATFVSPFIGRLDDISHDGLSLIAEILQIFHNYQDFTTEVLAASIRHPLHVIEAAKLGAHAITLPPKIFKHLYHHPLTEQGLKTFMEDWQKVKNI